MDSKELENTKNQLEQNIIMMKSKRDELKNMMDMLDIEIYRVQGKIQLLIDMINKSTAPQITKIEEEKKE